MTFRELIKRLQSMPRHEALSIADAAGVPRSTLDKVRQGVSENPRIGTIEKLSTALAKRKVKEAA